MWKNANRTKKDSFIAFIINRTAKLKFKPTDKATISDLKCLKMIILALTYSFISLVNSCFGPAN